MTEPPVSPEDNAPDSRDIFVPEQTPSPARPESVEGIPSASRDADASDVAPPMNAPARGLMGQMLPDVSTGSTPVTRHDD